MSTGAYATEFHDLKNAAKQGDLVAQTSLGLMYRDGEGVPQNYKEAIKWLALAAELGDAAAQFLLGTMYAVGEGVPQDYVQCFIWLSLAVASGGEGAGNRYICEQKLSLTERDAARQKAQKMLDALPLYDN